MDLRGELPKEKMNELCERYYGMYLKGVTLCRVHRPLWNKGRRAINKWLDNILELFNYAL